MKKIFAAAGLSALLVGLMAAPAFAHATFDRTSALPETELDIVLKVPSEIDNEHSVKIVLELPAGFEFRNCIASGSWGCTLDVAQGDPPRDLITWTPSAGATEGLETFQFRVPTPKKMGRAVFDVNQTYSNGEVVHWDNADADADEPAPSITVSDVVDDTEQTLVATGSPDDPVSNETGTDETMQADSGDQPHVTAGAVEAPTKKKAKNLTPLYITIALWLAVAIPVLMAGMKKPEHTEDHH